MAGREAPPGEDQDGVGREDLRRGPPRAGWVGADAKARARGHTHVLTARRDQLDLRDQAAVNSWFRANRPGYVFLVAGTVGGILANSTRPAEFIYDNMMIHATVVHAAHVFGVKKLLYLGSSCLYPREAPQPLAEDALLSGRLEPTNEPYALPKSRASSYARRIVASTDATSFRRRRRISTGRTTTSISKALMCSRP